MAASSIRVEVVVTPPEAIVLIRGDIDFGTGPALSAEIDALAPSITSVVLDLTHVGFVDSTGLGLIANLLNRLVPVGGRVTLRNPSPLMVRMLSLTELLQYLTVVDERT